MWICVLVREVEIIWSFRNRVLMKVNGYIGDGKVKGLNSLKIIDSRNFYICCCCRDRVDEVFRV